MEKKFEYRGDLAVTPLPEILATIGRYRVPGALSIASANRQRRIYVDGGLVVFAISNEPDVWLGTFLIRQGVLPEEAVRSAEERLAGDGVRLGQILLRLELLDHASLEAAIAEQVREILWSGFDWENGEVVFEVGARRSDEAIRIDLPIDAVIVAGIRRIRAVRRLIDRLGSGHGLLERSTDEVPAGISISALNSERSAGATNSLPISGVSIIDPTNRRTAPAITVFLWFSAQARRSR